MPACGVLLGPWADLTLRAESHKLLAECDVVLDFNDLASGAEAYWGGEDAEHPAVSPVFADLTGLPPLLVQAGGADTLLDDASALARTAGLAGVAVTLEVWPEMPHGWQGFSDYLDEAGQALDAASAWADAKVGSLNISGDGYRRLS